MRILGEHVNRKTPIHMVQYRLDGTGSFRPEVKCYPSRHAWRTWQKGQAIFRVPGV